MRMTRERKHAIGYQILLARIAKEGIVTDTDAIRRQAGNESKKLGIPVDELLEFYLEFITDLATRGTAALLVKENGS